jgi:RimJ/RimL family protein N-acetyltransferase
MIETERLILRPYADADRAPFAEINGHPEVGRWLAGVLDREASDALMDRINAHISEHGFGFWAAERRSDGRLVGAIGLLVVRDGALPCGPAVEIGWRLHPDAQGQGLASEGAAAALAWGFLRLPVDEIVAFTAQGNLASRAVMRRIGMAHDPARDFDHPKLAEDDPLRRHVLYAVKRAV